jgi:RNA polymerase sigma-70 factor, ECF subfamily
VPFASSVAAETRPRRWTPAEPPRLRSATLRPVRSDSELVAAAQRGDTLAFRELVRAHQRQVARLAQRLLGRSNDLEDVVQETFLQLHRSLKDFRAEARFSTYLHRVTVNVCLMYRRAQQSRPRLTDTLDAAPPADPRLPPDELVARNARLQAFERLLQRLSEKKRTVFVLHELEGVPFAEIATILGTPVLTVRTRLFYARRELAQWFREEPTLAALAHELETKGQRAQAKLESNDA